MASVVDSRRSPASPLASPASSRRSSTPSAPKTNPVALEVPVIATGARPGDSGGQRDLFTEETTTVLVFENGAVIRLSAAVAAGQLLFLTHKESRREVVAQVTRKRDFRPTNCYVEVEFSEPAPGFWGVKLSENREPLPATAQQKEAAELVQGSRIVSSKESAPAPAPNAAEVEKLKEEVEALREQLRSMQTQTTAENSPKHPAPAVIPTPPPALTVAATPREDSPKSPAARARAPGKSSPPPSRVASSLPVEREATAFEEKPFTKPEIRVNRQKPALERSPKPIPAPSGNLRPEARRAAVLSLLLLAGAAGAAWYLNWIPWLKPPKKPAVHAASSAPVPAASSAPQKTAMAATDSGKPSQAGGASVLQPAVASRDTVPPAAGAAAAKPSDSSVLGRSHWNGPDVHVAEVAPGSVVAPAAAKRVVPLSSDKTASASSSQPLSSVSPQPLPSGSAVVPPKLIKSVRAVASPSALRYFDKGNTVTVTLDALVDVSGAVKSMKVLAGPASLHHAAMDALKQYRYAPARQNGERIAAHVTVTIKFLFEP